MPASEKFRPGTLIPLLVEIYSRDTHVRELWNSDDPHAIALRWHS